jgi:hypothetical protein
METNHDQTQEAGKQLHRRDVERFMKMMTFSKRPDAASLANADSSASSPRKP